LKYVLPVLLMVCCLASAVIAQQPSGPAVDDVRLSKDHPAVYITFERRGRAVDPMKARLAESEVTTSQRPAGDDYYLRLHNNSRWAIRFSTISWYMGNSVSAIRLSNGQSVLGLNDGLEVNAFYSVEESDGRRVPYGGDTYSQSWLTPGRSVLFSVARAHLAEGRSIFIDYRYEWEDGQEYSNNLAPEHRSMYWGYRLETEAR